MRHLWLFCIAASASLGFCGEAAAEPLVIPGIGPENAPVYAAPPAAAPRPPTGRLWRRLPGTPLHRPRSDTRRGSAVAQPAAASRKPLRPWPRPRHRSFAKLPMAHRRRFPPVPIPSIPSSPGRKSIMTARKVPAPSSSIRRANFSSSCSAMAARCATGSGSAAGFRMGRRQVDHAQGRMAGLDAAAGNAAAPTRSAPPYGRRPRQSARRPRALSRLLALPNPRHQRSRRRSARMSRPAASG